MTRLSQQKTLSCAISMTKSVRPCFGVAADVLHAGSSNHRKKTMSQNVLSMAAVVITDRIVLD